jgi:hypothetical protein
VETATSSEDGRWTTRSTGGAEPSTRSPVTAALAVTVPPRRTAPALRARYVQTNVRASPPGMSWAAGAADSAASGAAASSDRSGVTPTATAVPSFQTSSRTVDVWPSVTTSGAT